MSGTALRWAHAQTAGNLTLKAVLLALASRAHDDGCTWVSQGTLATDLECDVRTIRRSLQALEDKGFLVREDRVRDDGSRASDMIRLVLHAPDRKSGGGDRESGGAGTSPGGTRSQSPGAPVTESPLTTFEQKPTQQESQESLDSNCAWPVDFRDQFQKTYPHWVKGRIAFAELDRLHREGDVPFEAILDGISCYVASKPPDRNWMGPDRFLADRRFEDRPAPMAPRLVRSDGASPPSQPTGRAKRQLELAAEIEQELRHGTGPDDVIAVDDQPSGGRGEDRGVAWASGAGRRPPEPLLRAVGSGGHDHRAAAALRRARPA